MSAKRILIVDDEPSIRRILKRGLDSLGKNYEVVTAANGYEALAYVKAQPFDLIVTDYKMAGLDGLALLEEIRRLRPEARVVLMTAYGSSEVEARAQRLKAYRYLAKPLEMDDFRQMVQAALDDMAISNANMLVLSDERYRQAAEMLAQLQSDVGAQAILLVNVFGQIIIRQGETEGLPLSEIVTLLGGGIATLVQAGKAIDEAESAVNLIYREGSSHHLYGINVGESLLLIILIPAGNSPLGSVWYYARRTVPALREVIGDTGADVEAPLDDAFGEALEDELDSLFGLDDEDEEEAPAEAPTAAPATQEAETGPLLLDEELPPPPPEAEAEAVFSDDALPEVPAELGDDERLLGFEDAARLGLVPREWVTPPEGDEI